MLTQLDSIPSAENIVTTHEAIAPYINHTPVLTSESINNIAGAELFFKCENFQKVGAFKMRGACSAGLRLTNEQLQNGLATHSSGNHAQAVALTAKLLGVPAYIVMPDNAPLIKQKATAGYGANITFCKNTLEARASTLAEVVAQTGATFIHPYNDYNVIAGQATAAKELIEDIPELDILIAPIGGGGLMSGTALSAHYFSTSTTVYGSEPQNVDDAYRSFQSGQIEPNHTIVTVADGLRTLLGEKTLDIIRRYVKDIFTVSEDEIIEAMQLIWQRMKIIIEPSCAVPVAAILKNREVFKGKRVGVIITGGNVDLGNLPFK
jgi:threonine dehydratase